jgi:hypothetical protein
MIWFSSLSHEAMVDFLMEQDTNLYRTSMSGEGIAYYMEQTLIEELVDPYNEAIAQCEFLWERNLHLRGVIGALSRRLRTAASVWHANIPFIQVCSNGIRKTYKNGYTMLKHFRNIYRRMFKPFRKWIHHV